MRTDSSRRSGIGLPAVASTLALALAACGGTTAKTTGPASAPTKAGFISQADAVCRSARTSLSQFQAPTRALLALGDTPRAYAQAAALFRRVQSLEQGELSRLEALRLPTADRATVTSYLHGGTAAVALVGRLADAFAKRDKPALAALVRQGGVMAATTKGLAQGYGFKVCGHAAAGNGLT